MPLHVFEPRYRALMRDCLAGDPRFGVVLIERGSEVGGGDERAALGTRGVITRAVELPDGRWLLEVVGRGGRSRSRSGCPTTPTRSRWSGTFGHAGQTQDGRGTTSWRDRARSGCAGPGRMLAEHGGAPPLSPDLALDGGGDPEVASWQLCAAAPVSAYDAQRFSARGGAAARALLLVELMEDLELDLQRMTSPE